MKSLLLVIIPILVLTPSSLYAFKAFIVNQNKTIDLPIQPRYSQTTIQPGSTCTHDSITVLTHDVPKEKTQNPTMYKSDVVLAVSLPKNTATQSWVWCGIEK
jgi:hypothetical protein